jgi:hypothetical protein
MNVRSSNLTVWTIVALAIGAGLSLTGCNDRQAARDAALQRMKTELDVLDQLQDERVAQLRSRWEIPDEALVTPLEVDSHTQDVARSDLSKKIAEQRKRVEEAKRGLIGFGGR